MQIELLILLAALLAYDPLGPVGGYAPQAHEWAMAWLLPPLAFVAISWAWTRHVLRIMTHRPHRTISALKHYGLFIRLAHGTLAGTTLMLLFAGEGLSKIRTWTGDWIVLDELAFLAPFVSAMILEWCAFYDVDNRLRSEPAGTRRQYLFAQIRQQWLLGGVPMLCMLAIAQSLDRLESLYPTAGVTWQAVNIAGLLCVLLITPWLIRHLWATQPLPPSPLRTTLMAMCRDHGVRIRQLLIWKTYGGAVNGAVMGLLGPMRYILLTDGLLQRLNDRQVEAVMAHEIAHAKLHHIPGLMACAIGLAFGLETVAHHLLGQGGVLPESTIYGPGDVGTLVQLFGPLALILLVWLVLFGWVSRRFERQADTFAVRHLVATAGPDAAESLREAVETYSASLLRVAEINRIPLAKRGWRHGSIQWRLNYLQRLARPHDLDGINRQVLGIHVLSSTLILALLVYHVVLPLWAAFVSNG